LRFVALLFVNKVEAVVREIRKWFEEFKKKNGVSESVLRKRIAK